MRQRLLTVLAIGLAGALAAIPIIFLTSPTLRAQMRTPVPNIPLNDASGQLWSLKTTDDGSGNQSVNVVCTSGCAGGAGAGTTTINDPSVTTQKAAVGAAGALKINLGEYGGTATTLGQKAMAASIPVVLPSDQTVATTASTTPAARTLVTLDVKTVTTGGTAVTAISAGHRTAGGWIQNPPTATINLCINEIGTATGTTTSGDTICIIPGATYNVAPGSGAVSVISSDSSHPFGGYGLQ